jgi:DNA-directed RNA polymerase specialized sigma24 family protein
MTNAEISSTFGITAGEVGVALHKARARLRELLAAGAPTRSLTAAACIVD